MNNGSLTTIKITKMDPYTRVLTMNRPGQRDALTLARQIAANSPEGVSAARQLILKSCDLDLQLAMALSCALRDPMDGTAAALEGIQAWADKRTPDFS
jgi:enoyl-CoA hydratase/carnithine racemase